MFDPGRARDLFQHNEQSDKLERQHEIEIMLNDLDGMLNALDRLIRTSTIPTGSWPERNLLRTAYRSGVQFKLDLDAALEDYEYREDSWS